MVFGNGQGKKPIPVREKFPDRPTTTSLQDYKPEGYREGYGEPSRVEASMSKYDIPASMNSLAKEIQRDRIREIALLTKELTYGEMCSYDEGLEKEGAPSDFKKILHAWALTYLKKDDPP